MTTPRVRLAPSPTGAATVGVMRLAVFDYLFARHTGGTFVLRIEDTDRNRFVEGSLEDMMASLRWLGMQWDEGPEVGGPVGPYLQSERLEHYHKYAEQLISEGKAYYCYAQGSGSMICARVRRQPSSRQAMTAAVAISPTSSARSLSARTPTPSYDSRWRLRARLSLTMSSAGT
jgi:glutamyl/glutaminyl-tRNA synthetase